MFQVEECHLPGLGVALTLDYKPDAADEAVSPLVSYVSGLLLGTNSKVRTWFSMFIRNGQQVGGQRLVCVQNMNPVTRVCSSRHKTVKEEPKCSQNAGMCWNDGFKAKGSNTVCINIHIRSWWEFHFVGSVLSCVTQCSALELDCPKFNVTVKISQKI